MDGGSAAIGVVVQNVIDVLKEEYFLIQGLNEEAKQLQKTLGIIQGYLNDAEKKSIDQDSVKIWLRDLEALAFDADNVLDELSYHLLRKKVKKMKTPMEKLRSSFSSSIHIPRRRNMALTIKQINADFEIMNKTATDLGLQSILVNAPAAAPLASFQTNSFTLDPIFIGRDDNVGELVEKLTQIQADDIFSIVAIVGMGGLGKTTLTRKVFNHENLKARFGSHIWVHVSQTFDPVMLFSKILSTLVPQASAGGVENEESILKQLKEAFKDKTYLLVLDDVWNEDREKWEKFINSISGVTSTMGNAVIITTRKVEVASTVRPLHNYPLQGLSDEACWSIIKAKTFGNGDVPSGFEIIGRRIAERCQGMPLAANVVGGLLCSKSEQEWLSVQQKWLPGGEGNNITKVLRLSFDNLSSSSLKKCFAYCSIFPKGYKIVKQELIEMWMAEGFVQHDEMSDMESVGNKFVNVLLHNSLLLAAGHDGYGKSWVMLHDLVHDMACSVLGCSNNADGVRYMFLKKAQYVPTLSWGSTYGISKEKAKHVRTLYWEGGAMDLSDFECLHVLILNDAGVKELPSSIRKLKHLRSLNISHTGIEKLPEWIGELHHLQTLRVEVYYLKKLPSTFKYLTNLRHLYIPYNVELPAEIGKLTCLQTLRHFRVGDEKGYQIEELGSLNNLKGKLEISNLEKVHDKVEAEKANISQKPDLHFRWNSLRWREGERDDESVLEGLQPHRNANLEKLGIDGFNGEKFPLWCKKMAVEDGCWVPLDKLIDISLSRCLECEELPKMEHLPNLKKLSLIRLEKVRCVNFLFNKFIRELSIHNLDALECLPDGLDTLNYLESLTIQDCRNLKSIGNPSGGTQATGNLRRLSIQQCQKLTELPRQMVEWWAQSINAFELRGLCSLKNLPMLIDCLANSPRLTQLTIVEVPKFMTTRKVESWAFGSLKKLEIDVSVEWSMESSDAIKETVDGILQGCGNSLTELWLRGVENWDCLPQSMQHLTALSKLELHDLGVEELPQWFRNFSSLHDFHVCRCKKLKNLDALESLNFEQVYIEDCPVLCIDHKRHNILSLSIKLGDTEIYHYI